jgi:hypothetical protein
MNQQERAAISLSIEAGLMDVTIYLKSELTAADLGADWLG